MFFGRIRRRIRNRVLRSNEPAQEYTVATADLSAKDKHVASLALQALSLEPKQNSLSKDDMMGLLYAVGLNPTEDVFDAKLRIMHLHTQETFTFGHFCFVWGLMQKDSVDEEEMLKKAFQFFDKDGNNEISVNELKTTMHELGDLLSEAEIQEFVGHLDRDNNGVISYDEFIKELRSQVAGMPSHSTTFDKRYSKSGQINLKASWRAGNSSLPLLPPEHRPIPAEVQLEDPASPRIDDSFNSRETDSQEDESMSSNTPLPGYAPEPHHGTPAAPGGSGGPMQVELATSTSARWKGLACGSSCKEPSDPAHEHQDREQDPDDRASDPVPLPGTPDYVTDMGPRIGSSSQRSRSDSQMHAHDGDSSERTGPGEMRLRSPSHLDPPDPASRHHTQAPSRPKSADSNQAA